MSENTFDSPIVAFTPVPRNATPTIITQTSRNDLFVPNITLPSGTTTPTSASANPSLSLNASEKNPTSSSNSNSASTSVNNQHNNSQIVYPTNSATGGGFGGTNATSSESDSFAVPMVPLVTQGVSGKEGDGGDDYDHSPPHLPVYSHEYTYAFQHIHTYYVQYMSSGRSARMYYGAVIGHILDTAVSQQFFRRITSDASREAILIAQQAWTEGSQKHNLAEKMKRIVDSNPYFTETTVEWLSRTLFATSSSPNIGFPVLMFLFVTLFTFLITFTNVEMIIRVPVGTAVVSCCFAVYLVRSIVGVQCQRAEIYRACTLQMIVKQMIVDKPSVTVAPAPGTGTGTGIIVDSIFGSHGGVNPLETLYASWSWSKHVPGTAGATNMFNSLGTTNTNGPPHGASVLEAAAVMLEGPVAEHPPVMDISAVLPFCALVFIVRLKSNTIYSWNAKCEEVTGFHADSVRGKDVFSVFADDISKDRARIALGASDTFMCSLKLLSEFSGSIALRSFVLHPSSAESECVVFISVPLEDTFNKTYHQYTVACTQYMSSDALHVLSRDYSQSDIVEARRILGQLGSTDWVSNLVQRWCEFSQVHVRQLVGDAIESVLPLARKLGVQLTMEFDTDVPESFVWESVKTVDVIKMLATKCVKAMSKKGRVRVRGRLVQFPSLAANNAMAKTSSAVRFEITECDRFLTESSITEWHEMGIVTYVDSDTAHPVDAPVAKVPLSSEEYDLRVEMTSLVQGVLVPWGGKITCRVDKEGTTYGVQIPNLPPTLSDLHNSMQGESECNNSTLSKPDIPSNKQRLEIAFFESNSMFRVQIGHAIFNMGHFPLKFRSSSELVQHVEETKSTSLVLYDIDASGSYFEDEDLDTIRKRCEEAGIVMALTTFTSLKWPERGMNVIHKPFERPELLEMEELCQQAYKKLEEQQSHQEQVSSLRSMFSEVKSSPWTLGSLIGKGASGEVYAATATLTGGKMAVKMIPLDTMDDAKTQDLLNEISILRTLQHPNIVHYFNCERAAETVNIFMEYADGGSLLNRIERKALSPAKIATIMKSVLEAIAYLHDIRIVHRDIKAANVLISHGEIKLADFGTATQLKEGKMAEGMKGSMRYMAPEVMRGVPYDQSCDIWSVGCMLLEMITREPPFSPRPPLSVFSYVSDLKDGDVVQHGVPDTQLPAHAKSFLESCLVVNPSLRSSAKTLLSHPFLGKKSNPNLAVPTLARRNTTASNASSGRSSRVGSTRGGGDNSSDTESRRSSVHSVMSIISERSQAGVVPLHVLRRQIAARVVQSRSDTNNQSGVMNEEDERNGRLSFS